MNRLNRLIKLKEKLIANKIDAILITGMPNINYLTGFTGSSAMLLVSSAQTTLITDFRYTVQAQLEVDTKKIILQTEGNALANLKQILSELKPERMGFEAENITYKNYEKIYKICCGIGIKTTPCRQFVNKLRQVKDADEIDKIKQAIMLAETAFIETIGNLKPGIRENELAVELEFAIRRLGSGILPFEIIVASGKRSALPHGTASDKKILSGELIVIDFGASYKGYCSDISRSILLGRPDERQLEIYNTVAIAQEKAIQNIKPEMTAEDADNIARKIISEAGYGEYFGHGSGHGVGLEVHEAPYINPRDKTVLTEGMVFTVEPGIYLPNVGGVRIEDMLLITHDGCEVLTGLPKNLTLCN